MVATILVRRIAATVAVGVVPRRGCRRSIKRMLGPTRPLPRVGAKARIAHFGGGFEIGTVVGVHDQGHRVEVRGESGDDFEFVLNAATARFVLAGSAQGPRLELLD
jgi:hypothetical protein